MSEFITDPDHSIIKQSLRADEVTVQINGDGFGVAWYVPGVAVRPAAFKEITPAWNSHNLLELADVTTSPCILAHVRLASTGSLIQQSNCHPFVHDKFSFMHNGGVCKFSEVKLDFINKMSKKAFSIVQGSTDSEHLFGLWLDSFWKYEGEAKAGDPDLFTNTDREGERKEERAKMMARALVTLIHTVGYTTAKYRPFHKDSNPLPKTLVHGLEEGHVDKDLDLDTGDDDSLSLLNIVVTDGEVIVASRFTFGHLEEAHTLFYCRGHEYRVKDGKSRIEYTRNNPDDNKHSPDELIIISSEPLTEKHAGDFVSVPPNHIIITRGVPHFGLATLCGISYRFQ
eukprot:TRINITY_DN11771_c0_g1_i2.p1 TRINITY_DN11771_c0_g1~~TRINITY_DN11771_c0_g1_i2.p1  ORF type:complete len:360 (+),score=86.50 TRINITY_DN11771_c0_g1_i2:60-1082(+)